MVEIEEGQTYKDDPRLVGSSTYFLLSEEIKKYLGFDHDDEIIIRFKADKSKHGRYLGVWLEKVEKNARNK